LFCELESAQNRDFRSARDHTRCSIIKKSTRYASASDGTAWEETILKRILLINRQKNKHIIVKSNIACAGLLILHSPPMTWEGNGYGINGTHPTENTCHEIMCSLQLLLDKFQEPCYDACFTLMKKSEKSYR
jgi:hypothetical protein